MTLDRDGQIVMRSLVVLDTNVLLDLYVYQDPRAAALQKAIENQRLDLLTCAQAMTELTDVLSREKFRLTRERQRDILEHWQINSRSIADAEILESPWHCKDRSDQIFLDLAWTFRPATLLSKDLQVLRFAKRALKESVVISTFWDQ